MERYSRPSTSKSSSERRTNMYMRHWIPRRRTHALTRDSGSNYVREVTRERRILAGERHSMPTPLIENASKLFICNVDRNLTRLDLESYFESFFGFCSSFVKLAPDRFDRRQHRGFGYAVFQNAYEATSALLNLNGGLIGEKHIFMTEYYKEDYLRKFKLSGSFSRSSVDCVAQQAASQRVSSHGCDY